MNEPWITIFPIVLVTLALSAGANLLRIFVGDWLAERREERQNSFRKNPDAGAPRSSQPRHPRRALTVRYPIRTASRIAAAALGATSAAALAQEQPSDAAASPAALSLAPASLQNGQPEQAKPAAAPAPEAEKPLTISTDRPGFSDTTGIVQAMHLQLELGYTFTYTDRNSVETQTHNGPEMLWRFGMIDDRLELRVGTSGYVYSRTDSGSGFVTTDGFSDVAVGLKLKLWDQDKYLPRTCLEPLTTVGLGSNDISNQDVEPTLKLLCSWDLGSNFNLTCNADVSYATSGGERFTQGAGSASLGYTVNDKVSLFFEYYVIAPNAKGSGPAHSIDFGGSYLLTNRIQFDARAGFGLNEQASNFFAGVGLSFLF